MTAFPPVVGAAFAIFIIKTFFLMLKLVQLRMHVYILGALGLA